MTRVELLAGDCLDVLRGLPDASVDSIVTDPPYGLAFMGKRWDYDVPNIEVWQECLRVLKPGGHLLAFAGTRTQHRLAVRIEDAGFEIRDMIAWVYGSGFPKSLDVAKEIDKNNDIWRGRAGESISDNQSMKGPNYERIAKGSPVTDAAKQWNGWGTALKPALEPITVARKPLTGTVAENVLAFGTGALNIDGCRIDAEKPTGWGGAAGFKDFNAGLDNNRARRPVDGRWPANFIHDGSAEVLALFPDTGSTRPSQAIMQGKLCGSGKQGMFANSFETTGYNDSGNAARFFYCAKTSAAERNEGLHNQPTQPMNRLGAGIGEGNNPQAPAQDKNHHPTVKPIDLMAYLCRLVTPPGGVVLDPFMGSGSTGVAAVNEGFGFLGIERELAYFEIAKQRISYAQQQLKQMRLF